MVSSISDQIRLYGTDEVVELPRLLRAGSLTAEFEAGNLRHICFQGREMIRALSFVVRDKDWGTYAPLINDLSIQEEAGIFRLSYLGIVKQGEQEFRFQTTISGQTDGTLTFSAKGTATSDFLTNRTGFVVLHPIEGVAGAACAVEHVNGLIEETTFPFLIDPVQPMTELRAITYEFLPGLSVSCRMEGDTFEMEDQRNWTDASYKTYVRPLALPWPYLIRKGESIDQRITLTVIGTGTGIESGSSPISIKIGQEIPAAFMPPLGFGLDPEDLLGTEQSVEILKSVAPSHLVCFYDPRLGHSRADLNRMANVGRALAADLWLEFVIPTVDHFEEDIQDLGRSLSELGSPFSTILISPAPDLKCTLPGSPWPPCPPLHDCYRAARQAFPELRLGGGMFSFFTELNRKRPPLDLLDFVTFTTVAIFHAGDDRSATEGLESLPYLAKSVAAFIDGKPYHVGPSAIGLRMNPYGEAPVKNPHNIRQAMNGMDPRQRGLFAAAWAVGFVAQFAKHGASALTLGSGVGKFGLVHVKTDYPQPWFDDQGGVYPIYHAVKGLAAMRGRPLVELALSAPRDIQAVATKDAGRLELWITNLTDQSKTIDLQPRVTGTLAILSAKEFEQSTRDLSILDSVSRTYESVSLTLPPFAIARFRS